MALTWNLALAPRLLQNIASDDSCSSILQTFLISYILPRYPGSYQVSPAGSESARTQARTHPPLAPPAGLSVILSPSEASAVSHITRSWQVATVNPVSRPNCKKQICQSHPKSKGKRMNFWKRFKRPLTPPSHTHTPHLELSHNFLVLVG